MKKYCSIMLAVLSIWLPLGAAAAEQAVSLPELRAGVPERLVLEVTTQEGETVRVDAAIDLPEGGALPILRAEPLRFDAANMTDHYPLPAGLSSTQRKAQTHWNYDGSPVLSIWAIPKDGNRSRIEDRIGMDSFDLEGGQPAENGMPPERPLAILRENLLRFSPSGDADIRVIARRATSGQYGLKDEYTPDNGSDWYSEPSKDALDPSKPIKGYSKGFWKIRIAQYLEGAEVFQGRYNPWPGFEQETGVLWPDPARGDAQVLEEDDFYGYLELLSPTESLTGDTPLVPFETVRQAIAERIQAGDLRSVYRLSLGYTVCYEQALEDVRGRDPRDPGFSYVLVPTWRVIGYDRKDAERRETHGGSEPSMEELIQTAYTGAFELRLDARTGEPWTEVCYPGR